MTLVFSSAPQLAACGGFIIIFGFLAFNGSSVSRITVPGDVETMSLAIQNSVMAASSAALVALFLRKMGDAQKWSFMAPMNGAVAGMVSMTMNECIPLPMG